MAVVGSTIILKAEFPNSIGDLSLLSDVSAKVYTENLLILLETIIPTKISDGVYEAYYTIQSKGMPNDLNLLYEFSGKLNGYQYLGRGVIPRTYVT